jgi:hypothetical protein
MARYFVGRKADSQSALFGNSPIFAGRAAVPWDDGPSGARSVCACVRFFPFVSPLSTGYLDERRGGGIWLAPPLWVVVVKRLRRLRPPPAPPPPRARPLRRRRPAPRHHDAPPAQSPSPAPIVADRANATHVTTRPSCAPCRSLQLPSAVADANAATAAVAATALTRAPAQPSGSSPAYLFP